MANGHGYVAYGASIGEDIVENPFAVGLWFSPDARIWRRIDLGDVDGSFLLTGAVASDELFLVRGFRGPCVPGPSCQMDPGDEVWTSSDGEDWQVHRVPMDPPGLVSSVASNGTGFMAIGSELGDGIVRPPAAWVSADGLDWAQVDAPAVDSLEAIAGTADGYLVLGKDDGSISGDETYTVWHSIDGVDWQPAGEFTDQVCCSPVALAATPERVVAVGAGDCDGQVIGAGWYLEPGSENWQRSRHSADLNDGFLWSATSISDGFAAAATIGSRVAALTSTNGSSWELRAILSEPGDWSVNGIAHGPTGLVLVGWESLDLSAYPPDESFHVWFLPEGTDPGSVATAPEPATDGCDTARAGLGLRAGELESHLNLNGDLDFATVSVDGEQVRRAINASGDVEVLLFGDTADIARIEIRQRGEQVSAMSTLLYWVPSDYPPDETWSEPLDEVQFGDAQRAELETEGMLITLDRLSDAEWDLELIIVPAP